MNQELVERLWAAVRAASPTWLVFDVGNVLVGWEPERIYMDRFPDPADREAFFKRVDLHAMNLLGDRGELAPRVRDWARTHPDDAAPILMWRSRWSEMFAPAIPETAALMERGRAEGMRIAALTNFAADTWIEAQAKYETLRGFDVEVVSGRLGALKPEPEIYAAMEAATGASGADLWFIDDKAENVAAAKARGWGGLVFDRTFRGG
ncbi:MAG: HAD-IA family hydrolase [Pseudomonadota bacterium]